MFGSKSAAKTPVDQALAAKQAGARLFQVALSLEKTSANVVSMVGAFTRKEDTDHSSVLNSIEAIGWKLENAGYVFRATGSESRSKFLSSGQQEAVSGEIIGIYIFQLKS